MTIFEECGKKFKNEINQIYVKSHFSIPYMRKVLKRKRNIGCHDNLYTGISYLQKRKFKILNAISDAYKIVTYEPYNVVDIDPFYCLGQYSKTDKHIFFIYIHTPYSNTYRQVNIAHFLDAEGRQVRYPAVFRNAKNYGAFIIQKIAPFIASRSYMFKRNLYASSRSSEEIIHKVTTGQYEDYLTGIIQKTTNTEAAFNFRFSERKIVEKHTQFLEYTSERGLVHKTMISSNGIDVMSIKFISKDNVAQRIDIEVMKGNDVIFEGSINQDNNLIIASSAYEDKCMYGYKIAVSNDGDHRKCLVKLKIPEDARVAVNKDQRKFRTDKAYIVNVYAYEYDGNFQNDIENNLEGKIKYCGLINSARSYVSTELLGLSDVLTYNTGELIVEPRFDGCMDKVCAPGIHFCLLKTEALEYDGYYNLSEDSFPEDENHV